MLIYILFYNFNYNLLIYISIYIPGRFEFVAMALASIINFFMPVSMAIDPNCDYYQNMILGQTYYIYNPQYPSNYPASTSCRWRGISEASTKIVITCEDIAIPSVSIPRNNKYTDLQIIFFFKQCNPTFTSSNLLMSKNC